MEKDEKKAKAGEKEKGKSRKRSHDVLDEKADDSGDDMMDQTEGDRLGHNEHMTPVGPQGYREDENELLIDLEEYQQTADKSKYFEEIQVEFDVHVIEEVDYKVLSRFLASFCQKQSFNNAELTDMLLNQKYLGSVIREVDDTDSYGFISVVPMAVHKDKECIKQIKRFILANCPDSKKGKWKELLEKPKLGLFLNERLINVPHAIAPQLNASIYEEVESMREEKEPFNIDTYVYLTTYGHKDVGDDREDDAQPKSKKIKKDGKDKKEWFKVEDEVYIKHATDSFEFFKSHSETRVAMFFSASKVPQILSEITDHVTANYNW